MRKETVNTFSEGMIKDVNELSMSNKSLSDTLNATFITFNGNEFALQNDMGNGRVHKAFLPAGYVPVGTKEHAGIIYIASHNPITGRNQIGSFPSPEKFIMSEKFDNSPNNVVRSDLYNSDGIKTAYLKKNLLDDGITIRPGDKFVVGASGTLEYTKGFKREDKTFPQFLKLHLAVIGKDNNISYLEQTEEKPYWEALEFEKTDTSLDDNDIEAYRSLIDENYIVYNNKTSGKLAIIVEFDIIKSFEVDWNITLEDNDKTVDIKLDCLNKWEYDYINACGVVHDLNIEYLSEDNVRIFKRSDELELNTNSLAFPDKDEEITDTSGPIILKGVDKEKLNKFPLFTYNTTPLMFFDKIDSLKRTGVIDLSKVNSGLIDLTSYKYFIGEDEINLNWGINAYLKNNEKISEVYIDYISYNDALNSNDLGDNVWNSKINKYIKTLDFKIRQNYMGTYEEVFTLGKDKDFLKDNFYLLKFHVIVDILDDDGKIIKKDDRASVIKFMYTTTMFNKYYIEQSYQDFMEIEPKGYLKPNYNIIKTTDRIITKPEFNIRKNFLNDYYTDDEEAFKSYVSDISANIYDNYKIVDDYQLLDTEQQNTLFIPGGLNTEGIRTTKEIIRDKIEYNENYYEIKGTTSIYDKILSKNVKTYGSFVKQINDDDYDDQVQITDIDDNKFSINVKQVRKCSYDYKGGSLIANKLIEPVFNPTKNNWNEQMKEIFGFKDNKYLLLSENTISLRKMIGMRASKRNSSYIAYFGGVNVPQKNAPASPFENWEETDEGFSNNEAVSSGRIHQLLTNNIIPKVFDTTPHVLPFITGQSRKRYNFRSFIKDKKPFINQIHGETTDYPMINFSMITNKSTKTNPRWKTLNMAICGGDTYDKGDYIGTTVGPTGISRGQYPYGFANLILSLYMQLYRYKEDVREEINGFIPNNIYYNPNSLSTDVNYSINIKDIAYNPNKLLNGFIQSTVNVTLSNFIKGVNLNNIPDDSSIVVTNENMTINKKDVYSNILNINDLISELILIDANNKIVEKIVYIPDEIGNTTFRTEISIIPYTPLKYYKNKIYINNFVTPELDVEYGVVRLVEASTITNDWYRDYDVLNKKYHINYGNGRLPSNIHKYLTINYDDIICLDEDKMEKDGLKDIGCVEIDSTAARQLMRYKDIYIGQENYKIFLNK